MHGLRRAICAGRYWRWLFRRGRGLLCRQRDRGILPGGRLHCGLPGVAEGDEQVAYPDQVSLLHGDGGHGAGIGRGDLDRRLVGLDLQDGLVLAHLVAHRDEHPEDLTLVNALSQVR